MIELIISGSLLFALLNPFLVIVYLIDVLEKLDSRLFRRVLLRAGVIASLVFCCFAILGDTIFSHVIHAEFASFQIFGGVVFLLIGVQFVFRGPSAIGVLRGESEHIAGAIAMPVLIGPGSIGASIIIGERHGPWVACAIVLSATIISIAIMLVLKSVHDFVRPRREGLIQRYIEIVGRIQALYIGTVSVEMIMRGLRTWSEKF
jgi:small neutral amino acid transporter SnatA (MarC family)